MANKSQIGSVVADDIIASSEVELMTQAITLLAGQGTLARGSVIGVITANGKGNLCDANSVDGSEVPNLVLSEEVDATADIVATCYKSGVFIKDKLVYGANGAPTGAEETLRKVNIHMKDQYAV